MENPAEFDSDNQVKNADEVIDDNQKNNKGWFKKVSKFIFSYVGLVIMVVIYACAGAYLFSLLEQHEEAKNCQEGKGQESSNIVNLKSSLLSYIQFNITNSNDPNKDNETVANEKIEAWLTEFRDQVLLLRSSYRYSGQSCDESSWTFPGALLFAITIITTIGYGHITPVTWEGQIVCICYATIGIPLFLMCIAKISGVLGDMFRFVYARICCRLCMKKKNPPANQPIDETKNTDGKVNQTGINHISDWDTKKNGAKVVDDDELEEDKENEDKVTVPLTITMIIITMYILFGALIFHLFEDWGGVEAGYFCYITLATIGFGDFVPGQNSKDKYAGPKLIAGAIYVLFGMAILAMCFDLMQEEIIAKFTWLGKKIGIIEKDESDLEEEKLKAENEKKEKEEKEKKAANKSNSIKPAYTNQESGFRGEIETPAPRYSSAGYDSYQN